MSSQDGGAPAGAQPFPPPVDRDDLGQGPAIMAITWIFQIAALIAVTARLIVRRHTRVPWGWDGYLMLAAVVSQPPLPNSPRLCAQELPTLTLFPAQTIQLALQSLATNSYVSGMGKHDRSLYPEEVMTILKNNWVSVPPGILVGILSRTSIAILLRQLFAPYKWFTYYLISFTALIWVAGIVQMPLTYAQVKPVEALWNFTIVPESRWDKRIWLYTAYFNQCMDNSHQRLLLSSFLRSLSLSAQHAVPSPISHTPCSLLSSSGSCTCPFVRGSVLCSSCAVLFSL